MLMRIVAESFNAPLTGSSLDFDLAYRQVTAAPEQARSFVVSMWDPIAKKVVLVFLFRSYLAAGRPPKRLAIFLRDVCACPGHGIWRIG